MQPKIVTIGVYGFDKDSFFKALIDANIDTFCDIRLRRGMRGSTYAFVNSESLQRSLSEIGIRYVHMKELAPTQFIRERQKQEDKKMGVAKRTREELSEDFIRAYEEECLSHVEPEQFIEQIGKDAKVVGLFCVEREPGACHRSLVARQFAQALGLQVEHVRP